MGKITVPFLTGLLWCFSIVANAEVVLIASPQFPVDQMTINEAKIIYLAIPWGVAGGIDVVPSDQIEGSPARNAFYASVIQKTPAQLRAHWAKLQFSEKGMPAMVVGDDVAVKKWVLERPNRIGYINGTAVDRSIKVLLKIP